MNENREPETGIQCPAIVFKLGEAHYTINSKNVESIMLLPEYQVVPDVPAYIMGIIMFRGRAIPLLDLRVVLGMPSLKQMYEEFVVMIEHRKQDHINWANELERCINANEPFTLATDPHKCAFGKWYDNFKTENNAVRFHLKKIDEPHSNLHRTALEVNSCNRKCGECTRGECLRKVVKRMKEDYVPVIVGLLDQTAETLRDSYREMVMVISSGGKQAGIIIDEVLAVEELEDLCDHSEINRFHKTDYVVSIKRSLKSQSLILEVDEARLLELAASAVDEAKSESA